MTTTRTPGKIIPRAFPGITPDEVSELIKNSKLANHPPETVLCRENAVENTFYLILEGRVEVTKVINNTEARLLKILGPWDFFGEMALIHNAPRAATVKTLTPLIALEINREAFDRVLKNSSSVSLAMVREISRRLRENDEMAIDDLRIRASELAEAYQKLAEQDMLRREFLTNVAHHLRTPLMAAGGYLQMIQKGAVPPARMPDAVDTVTRNVQQIVALVNDILFVQEMDLILGKFQPVNMADLAREIAARYRETAEVRRLELRVKPDLFLPPVSGDARSLERAPPPWWITPSSSTPMAARWTLPCAAKVGRYPSRSPIPVSASSRTSCRVSSTASITSIEAVTGCLRGWDWASPSPGRLSNSTKVTWPWSALPVKAAPSRCG
jgi:CRP/FNR family transcriptional regulator